LKILVTGGAGFVGSNLIKKLVKDKSFQVYSLDNYFTGKLENHVEGASYIKGECENIENLVNFIPDVVFHFGEYSRVSTSFEDYNKVWEYNVRGTYKVLEFCRKHNCKIIYSASSTKFGDNGDNVNKSPYAFFKSHNTDLIRNYSEWFKLNYVICYFYNVYGGNHIKKGKYATVIGIFEEQYTSKQPLTVVKPGTQKRDFTHIDDIVDGLILLMNRGTGDNYCLGTSKSYSIIEVAKMFSDDLTFIESRKGERNNSNIDLRKVNELGWKSKNNLKEYIYNFKNKNSD
jgi:UDP-glucose 4-epimerase